MIVALAGGFKPDPNFTTVGISSDDAVSQYYEDVVDILERQGFTDIEIRKEGWHLFHKSGTIKRITIDGNDEFFAYSRFSKDAKIVIFCYGN